MLGYLHICEMCLKVSLQSYGFLSYFVVIGIIASTIPHTHLFSLWHYI